MNRALMSEIQSIWLALNKKQIPQIVENKRNQNGDGAFGMNNPVPKAGALPGCATPRQ
jgi:hypothetical protein